MTINLCLLTSQKLFPEGYPLVYIIQHNGKKRKKQIGYALPEHFIPGENLISVKHPDFDLLFPEITDYNLKAKTILRKNPVNIDLVYDALFGTSTATGTFYDMATDLIKSLRKTADELALKGRRIEANKMNGNTDAYANAVSSLQKFAPDVNFTDIDDTLLLRFRKARELAGNKKATIYNYLGELRAVYNKLVTLHKLDKEKRPFAGVFKGLRPKASRARKKNVSRAVVAQIEGFRHDVESAHRWTDLWLLQFYFAGCDLKDIYYLKNVQLRKGRVYFERGKTNDEVVIDLAIHPKAQAIIDKYRVDGEYLFPWRKDDDGYKTFRRRQYSYLLKVQKRYGIELEGMGGNLTVKVARHSFSNIAKEMGIDGDLLRELMGHERNDVDVWYKDRFPQKVRDEALFRIIG